MDKIQVIGVAGKSKDKPTLTKEQVQYLKDHATEIAKAVNEAYLESERNHTQPLDNYRKT